MKLEDIYINIDNYIPKYAKLAGVSFNGRQNFIKLLKPGMALLLKRDYNNQYDKNAIAVYIKDNLIGWIPKYIAENLAPEIDFGIKWTATIQEVTGKDKDLQGVNIKLICLMD